MYDFPNVHPVDKNTLYRMRIQLAWYGSYQVPSGQPYMNHIRPVEYLTSLNWYGMRDIGPRWNKAVYIVPAENNVSLRYLIDLMINIYIYIYIYIYVYYFGVYCWSIYRLVVLDKELRTFVCCDLLVKKFTHTHTHTHIYIYILPMLVMQGSALHQDRRAAFRN